MEKTNEKLPPSLSLHSPYDYMKKSRTIEGCCCPIVCVYIYFRPKNQIKQFSFELRSQSYSGAFTG